jgi:hypothetical protein
MEERFKREHSRAQVVPSEISGMLTIVTDDQTEQIPFLVWDVSPAGIGVLAMDELTVGSEITLTIGHPYVMVLKTKVTWCVNQGGDGFRCGLKAVDNQNKLNAIYDEFCKMRKAPSSKEVTLSDLKPS